MYSLWALVIACDLSLLVSHVVSTLGVDVTSSHIREYGYYLEPNELSNRYSKALQLDDTVRLQLASLKDDMGLVRQRGPFLVVGPSLGFFWLWV